MANTDRPHGFGGFGAHLRLNPYDVLVGYGTAIFIGDVVVMTADGTLEMADTVSAQTKLGASASHSAASTATSSAEPLLVLDHPDQLFEAQDDGVSVTVHQNLIGSKADHIDTHSGSTTTLLSGHELDGSDMTSGAGGFAILDLVQREDNTVANNADWVCQLNTGEGLLTLAAGV